MAEGVKVGIGAQILQGALEIFQVCLRFIPALKIRRKVGIAVVYQVNGTDHKVERIRKDQAVVPFAQIGAQTQFHADAQIDLILIFFFQRLQPAEIFARVKFKADVPVRIVVVHVVGEAQMLKTLADGLLDHGFRRNAAVS